MENTQVNTKLIRNDAFDESLRVQKTAYIKQQMERQRAAEDARLEHLLREQEVIEGLRGSIDDSMWETEGVRKYNREFQEYMNRQIYEAHGITEDKLAGMEECKNALYRGAAAVLFLLSLVLTILCGIMHGFQSDVCLLMLAYMAMEGTLLSPQTPLRFTGWLIDEKKRQPVLDLICRVLYILAFPTMLVMFVCFSMKYRAYDLFLPYAAILAIFVTVVGTVSYFLYDPYHQDRKKMQEARKHIREIEKAAGKEIRREQKEREKDEKKARKIQEREEESRRKALETEEKAETGQPDQKPQPSKEEMEALSSDIADRD